MSADKVLQKQVVVAIDLDHLRGRARSEGLLTKQSAWRAVIGFDTCKRFLNTPTARSVTQLSPAGWQVCIDLAGSRALDELIGALGRAKDNPTYEQLSRAVAVVSESCERYELLAALAGVVLRGAHAAVPARQIIDELYSDLLSEVTINAPVVHTFDPEPREPRPQRAKPKPAKASPASPRPTYRRRRNEFPPEEFEPLRPTLDSTRALDVTRKVPTLTLVPAPYRARTDVTHFLVGRIARLDLPFLDLDDMPLNDPSAWKNRRCLITGVGPDFVVVRGIFSLDHPTRTLLGSWRRFMDKPSYVSSHDQVVLASRAKPTNVSREPIPVADWNGIL
jgi:hypothetical protein